MTDTFQITEPAARPPLLLVGHGTRSDRGREAFLGFAEKLQLHAPARPVVPCFLELSEPSIQASIDACADKGYSELTALPLLLFAARHSKFDVTNALDFAVRRHPGLTVRYGRHLGVSPRLLQLWQQRLEAVDRAAGIPPAETVLLFVGRGASDPDANGDAYKLARMLWEGTGYKSLEVCYAGITYPRLEQGLARALSWQPRRIVIIPHLLFAGVLLDRIHNFARARQEECPEIVIQALDCIGADPVLFELIGEREREAQQGETQMNCYTCKFRQAVLDDGHGHHHGHHDLGHHHHHEEAAPTALYHGVTDLYPEPDSYHRRAWQVP